MIDQEVLDEIGFTEFNIDDLDRETILSDEVFQRIMTTVNQSDRLRLISKLSDRAKELKKSRDFGKLLNAYQSEWAKEQRQKGSNTVQFTNPPIANIKCGEWECVDSGISRVVINNFDAKKIVACPHPILPVERLQNVETDTEKIKLAFFKDKQWKSITVDRSTIATRMGIVKLSDWGIDVTSESAKELVSFIGDIMNLNDIPLKKSIARMGWIEDVFIPYQGNLSFDGEQEFKSLFESVREHGNFDVWLKEAKMLRKYSIYNRLLLAASFVSPLISLLGINPFITHFWGGTGVGKTVGLMLSASVWGNPCQGKMVRSLNSTQVGMERNSVFLHDLPFIGDELQIIKSNFENFDKLIMYLCEGVGRGRGRPGGGMESLGSWNCSYVFSGEEPITKTASGGGAKNRCIEVECESSLMKDGNHTANLLRENYGFAGKRFLDILPNKEKMQFMYNVFHSEIMNTGTTEKQAMAMAALMVADDIVSKEIFNDKSLDFNEVAPFVMSAAEVDVSGRAYDWLCGWIVQNMQHFIPGEADVWGSIDCQMGTCFVLKTVLESALNSNGWDYRAIVPKLAEKCLVERNSQGKYVHARQINGVKATFVKLTKLTLDS